LILITSKQPGKYQRRCTGIQLPELSNMIELRKAKRNSRTKQ
jgi:hypothetical protein